MWHGGEGTDEFLQPGPAPANHSRVLLTAWISQQESFFQGSLLGAEQAPTWDVPLKTCGLLEKPCGGASGIFKLDPSVCSSFWGCSPALP